MTQDIDVILHPMYATTHAAAAPRVLSVYVTSVGRAFAGALFGEKEVQVIYIQAFASLNESGLCVFGVYPPIIFLLEA